MPRSLDRVRLYRKRRIASFITSVVQTGHAPRSASVHQALDAAAGVRVQRGDVDATVHEVTADSLETCRRASKRRSYELVDLDAEGAPASSPADRWLVLTSAT